MPPLARFRALPLPLFALVLVVALVLLGFACLCTDHPAQAVERALGVLAVMPPVLELWTFASVLASAFVISALFAEPRRVLASPASLQRFRF